MQISQSQVVSLPRPKHRDSLLISTRVLKIHFNHSLGLFQQPIGQRTLPPLSEKLSHSMLREMAQDYTTHAGIRGGSVLTPVPSILTMAWPALRKRALYI
jgi:hypothetical protein